MKYIRLFLFSVLFAPMAALAASNDFMVAAQLLAAARNGDVQQVQALVNNGADVNFVDSTGLSVVCTALMNNDVRAAQILQMYGADASKCDQQIKKYNTRNKKERSGGLFSGLSSAHTLTLAAAGAAVVVGGLLLATDVFGGSSGHSSSGGGTDRPNNNENNNDKPDAGKTTGKTTVPYGPAFLTTDGKIAYSDATYQSNLSLWDPSAGGIRELDFNYFRPTVQLGNNFITDGINVPFQNYLLTMHGYSPFANGYMGQYVFRDSSMNPVLVANTAGGGQPVGIALVTANGINPTGSAARGTGIAYADSASVNANTYRVDKYGNYGKPTTTDDVVKMGDELVGFDFSSSGTAMNPFVSATDNALAKIVAGWEAAGRATGDLYGFVPNGQLLILRTGGGTGWVDIPDATGEGKTVLGTVTKQNPSVAGVLPIEVGDTITLDGKTYEISSAVSDTSVTNPTITVGETVFKVPEHSKMFRAICKSENAADCENVSNIAIYQGTDSYYYANSTGGARPDAVYVIKNNNIYAQKTFTENADIRNFEAMFNNRQKDIAVLANVALNPQSRGIGYLTMSGFDDALALVQSSESRITATNMFTSQVDYYYDKDKTDIKSQGEYANSMYNLYGANMPIIVNSAGEFAYGHGDGKSLTILDATFENYAPGIYDKNLEHTFMTIVALQHETGTSAADSIDKYGNGTGAAYGPLRLATWVESTNNITYSSRKCGTAGLGANGIDPWCFAAAGPTAETATAAAAGAVGAIKGAFNYMSNPQIFALLALTADGPYLATNSAGAAYTKTELANYLKNMYKLPASYRVDELSDDQYFRVFSETFGYGMINLERATTPAKSIYYYNGGKLVTGNGNAYWRAASDTKFRTSSALNPKIATISAPFFDVLESPDGELRLPRVWQNEMALGTSSKHGLYMGDVMNQIRPADNTIENIVGDMRFSMAMSPRSYADNMNGLDYMSIGMTHGNFDISAGYQYEFTDGVRSFSGMTNPVLSMARNTISTDATYSFGKWQAHARAFSGAITDSTLLENDPAVSANFTPARLGLMHGVVTGARWGNEKIMFDTTIGSAHETDTLLGAHTGGLLNLGGGDTKYIDLYGQYKFTDNITMSGRATFAHTTTDNHGEFITGVSDIYSNSYAMGLTLGHLDFAVARPLAVRSGNMQYSYADYNVIDLPDGTFDIVTENAGIRQISLRPDCRETRFSGVYTHKFGTFTDGALGMIYRINPNNTDQFGNETLFMMKLTHRIGI